MDRFQTNLTAPASNSSTIAVADSSGVKVGDIVTEKDKLATQQITGLVVVIGKPAANTLTLSSNVTISNGTKLDFSRSSMTNKSSKYMSNRSSGNATIAGAGLSKTYEIKGSSTADTEFLYNGNNGTNAITGLGFSPDMLWLKSRSSGTFPAIANTVRGPNYFLRTNDTVAESGPGFNDDIVSFDSDGFTLGADTYYAFCSRS